MDGCTAVATKGWTVLGASQRLLLQLLVQALSCSGCMLAQVPVQLATSKAGPMQMQALVASMEAGEACRALFLWRASKIDESFVLSHCHLEPRVSALQWLPLA